MDAQSWGKGTGKHPQWRCQQPSQRSGTQPRRRGRLPFPLSPPSLRKWGPGKLGCVASGQSATATHRKPARGPVPILADLAASDAQVRAMGMHARFAARELNLRALVHFHQTGSAGGALWAPLHRIKCNATCMLTRGSTSGAGEAAVAGASGSVSVKATGGEGIRGRCAPSPPSHTK